MPIIEQTISASILTFLNSTSQQEDVEAAKKKFADDLAKIIADAIKSATLNIPTDAISVVTNGSSTTQTGVNVAPVTGNFLT